MPNAERAILEPRKLRDYLLSSTHAVGRHKSRFFLGLGYTAEAWAVLAADIRDLAVEAQALERERTEYGQKYEVRGELTGPSGQTESVVTVWITLIDEDEPRFVTAYPEV